MTTDVPWPQANLWLAQEAADPELLVVGVPSSRASIDPSRADLAPLEVRHRLDRFSTFHGELGVDFHSVAVSDMGNWAVSELDMVSVIDEVAKLAANLPGAGMKLFIGGDNAITRPLVASLGDDLSDVGLITFDAHHDVASLKDGPTNHTSVRGLIEEHGLRGRKVVQIGVHSFANSSYHRDYCDEIGITTVTLSQIDQIGMKSAVDIALSQLSAICDIIYVDVDLGVLDRAFAPACPGARPGGLTVRQLAQGVALCAAHPSVSAMDFVEVDPTIDTNHQTLDVLAHLLLTAVAGYAIR